MFLEVIDAHGLRELYQILTAMCNQGMMAVLPKTLLSTNKKEEIV